MAKDMTLEAVIKLQDEMSKELKKVQKNLDTFEDAAKDTNKALEDLQKESKATGKVVQSINFKQGAMLALEFGKAILDAAGALGDFVKEYQEFNQMQAKLAGSSKNFGYDTKFTENLASEMYGYLGDEGKAYNSVQNLLGLGLNNSSLDSLLEGATAAWSAYYDSIEIESLTEAIAETVTVGKVTGSLADTLNWTSKEEEALNKTLAQATTEQERAALVTEHLNKTYGEALKAYEEMDKAGIDMRNSEIELKKSKAELAKTLTPLITQFNIFANNILQSVLPAIQGMVDKIIPAIGESELLRTTFETTWNMMKAVIEAVSPTIQDIIQWFIDHSDQLSGIIETFGEIWSTVWEMAGPCIEQAWQNVKKVLGPMLSMLQMTLDVINGLIKGFGKISEAIGDGSVLSALSNSNAGNGNNTYQATKPKAFGQNYIPYDGYSAILHQGEAVLARRDADKWRNGKGNIPQITNNFYGMTIREEADIDKIASGIVRKINQQRIITSGR